MNEFITLTIYEGSYFGKGIYKKMAIDPNRVIYFDGIGLRLSSGEFFYIADDDIDKAKKFFYEAQNE